MHCQWNIIVKCSCLQLSSKHFNVFNSPFSLLSPIYYVERRMQSATQWINRMHTHTKKNKKLNYKPIDVLPFRYILRAGFGVVAWISYNRFSTKLNSTWFKQRQYKTNACLFIISKNFCHFTNEKKGNQTIGTSKHTSILAVLFVDEFIG